ncbi:MAG TPA: CHAT domain-containing protein, partial [Opitutus sp.]|nr:CHAT domain-containing protein [Opitutus sp.]
RPLKALLTGALAAQQELAVEPEKFVIIAGVDQDTTVGLRLSDDKNEFIFERSRAGDGTVPLDFAVLPNVLTYYHAEEHGSLPKNPVVHKAVAEILRVGSTTLLADRWERTRADAIVQVTETELRARFSAQVTRSVTDFSASDLRGFMSEFAAPSKPSTLPVAPAFPTGAAPVGAEMRPWESLVVGRRRQRRIDVRLARGSLTQVRSRAYLLGVFQNVEPGGAALAIDNLMDGTLREFRQRRMFAAGTGEVLLMPTGRSEVTADHVVFVGLGHFDSFNTQVLETVAENVARTFARMDIEEFATVPIGAGTGVDVEAAMRALLRGFFRGLDDADTDHDFRRITFCELDESRFEQLKWTLYRLWSTPLCEGVEVTLREEKLPPAPVARRATDPGIPPCIYLNVRARPQSSGKQLVFESSLLTTGAKATVLSGAATVDVSALAALMEEIESRKFNQAYLADFGTRLAALVLNDSVAAGLEGTIGNHLVVVHDAEASRIPWETLCLNEKFPGLVGGMSRRYLAADLSVAKWLEQRRHDDWLDVLLVVDPTEDLSGAVKEGQRIDELFTASQQVHLTVVKGKAATRARLRAEFASGNYDVLHYAGHAYFDPGQTARSGIVCSDGNLTGAELVELGNLPSLVFFNACESARVRSEVKRESNHVSRHIQERIQRNSGLAEAFMRGGVAN